MLAPGNVDDRDPLRNKSFIERIFGKLVGDKGYICRDLFSRLFVDGIQLITKLKSNMKGQLMTVSDKILLRKRALIETINDELKNIAQIEHSRHRSVVGFTVNLTDETMFAATYTLLYKHRNRCAHNTLSYQNNIPSFQELNNEKVQRYYNVFLFISILITIDNLFIQVYRKYRSVLSRF